MINPRRTFLFPSFRSYLKLGTCILFLGIFASCGLIKLKATKPGPGDTKTSVDQFLTKEHEYIKIPISKMLTGHLLVSVTINGVTGNFILDTGAGGTVVETKRKDLFKLKTEIMQDSGVGAGGAVGLEQSFDNTLMIGGLEIKELRVFVLSLEAINAMLSANGIEEIDGIIGADVLTNNKGIIDYSSLVLYLKK